MTKGNQALHRRPRRYVVPLVAVCLAVLMLLAALPVTIVGIQQRVIPPPRFAFKIGQVEFAAPCPIHTRLECDQPLPWYAIWRGDPEPDGTITYRQVFFLYLRPNRRAR
jgi:hypothetical protein